jgi:hypothetical protein
LRYSSPFGAHETKRQVVVTVAAPVRSAKIVERLVAAVEIPVAVMAVMAAQPWQKVRVL